MSKMIGWDRSRKMRKCEIFKKETLFIPIAWALLIQISNGLKDMSVKRMISKKWP